MSRCSSSLRCIPTTWFFSLNSCSLGPSTARSLHWGSSSSSQADLKLSSRLPAACVRPACPLPSQNPSIQFASLPSSRSFGFQSPLPAFSWTQTFAARRPNLGGGNQRKLSGAEEKRWEAEEMLELEKYDIEDIESQEGQDLVQKCSLKLGTQGFCVVPGFLRAQAVESMLKEVDGMHSQSYLASVHRNIWNEKVTVSVSGYDKSKKFDEKHLRRVGAIAEAGYLGGDQLETGGALSELRGCGYFSKFISAVQAHRSLPVEPISDEMTSCMVAILADNCALPWAFPRFDLQAILMLDASTHGGMLQILPNVRRLVDSEDSQAINVISTLIDAMEIERGLVEVDIEPPPLREILADMDPQMGACYFSSGPLSVKAVPVAPGDLVLLDGSTSLARFSTVWGGDRTVVCSFHFTSDSDKKFSLSEKRELLGRSRVGDFNNFGQVAEEDLMNPGDWKAFRMSDKEVLNVDMGDFGEAINTFEEEDRAKSTAEAVKAFKEAKEAGAFKED